MNATKVSLEMRWEKRSLKMEGARALPRVQWIDKEKENGQSNAPEVQRDVKIIDPKKIENAMV